MNISVQLATFALIVLVDDIILCREYYYCGGGEEVGLRRLLLLLLLLYSKEGASVNVCALDKNAHNRRVYLLHFIGICFPFNQTELDYHSIGC